MLYHHLLQLWTMFVIGSQARLIDLSHKHGPDTLTLFNTPRFNRTINIAGEVMAGVYTDSGRYSVEEHSGTHIDAPSHFQKGGKTLDDIPLHNTIADGVMIDCSKEASQQKNYQVTVQKILDWEKIHGQIPMEAAVIINFGWSSKYNDQTQYLGVEDGDLGRSTFPSVSTEAAIWLLDNRNIKMIGTDTVSPEIGRKGMKPLIHQRYLSNNRLIIENMYGTDQLPPTGFRLHAAPVKFIGGSGVQTRVYAMTFDEAAISSGSAVHLSGLMRTYAMIIALSVRIISVLHF